MQHEVTAERDLDRYGRSAPTASRYPQSISQHRNSSVSNNLYSDEREVVAAPANGNSATQFRENPVSKSHQRLKPLYTAEERKRRDATPWTLVQGILAPIQFLVFLVSVFFVVRYLLTGEGLALATMSIVAKTLLLYAIMITGSIWEREVFGVYLFAPAFLWEDVFSFLVLGLHTAYLAALIFGLATPQEQMLLALAAYAAYVVNATQFILKLRAARRDERLALASVPDSAGSSA